MHSFIFQSSPIFCEIKVELATPVFRNNPGFVGGGYIDGGAREFVIPNAYMGTGFGETINTMNNMVIGGAATAGSTVTYGPAVVSTVSSSAITAYNTTASAVNATATAVGNVYLTAGAATGGTIAVSEMFYKTQSTAAGIFIHNTAINVGNTIMANPGFIAGSIEFTSGLLSPTLPTTPREGAGTFIRYFYDERMKK